MRYFTTTLVIIAVSPWGLTQNFTIGRIAQSGDSQPASSTPFANSFANGFPAVHTDGTVSFVGNVSSVPRVYSGVAGGPLSLRVDQGVAMPGGGANTFADFGASTGIGTAGIAFWGANAASSPTLSGMYLVNPVGVVSRLADTTVIPPGQATPFTSFSTGQMASVNGTNVAFRGAYSGGSGVYAFLNGAIERVADTSLAIPNGTGNFSALTGTNATLSGSTAIFRGSGASSQQGIYLRDLSSSANPLIRVADRTMALPGTATPMTNIFEASVSGTNIQFIASAGTGTQRVVRYGWNGSSSAPAFTESVLTKFGDAVPGQATATFTGYGGFVPTDNGNSAVLGNFAGGSGIYWHDGTTLSRVVDTTQQLDGKSITSLLLGQDAVAGNFLTFQALFSDSTQGIYVVQVVPVPEPAAHVAVVGGLAWAVRRRRR